MCSVFNNFVSFIIVLKNQNVFPTSYYTADDELLEAPVWVPFAADGGGAMVVMFAAVLLEAPTVDAVPLGWDTGDTTSVVVVLFTAGLTDDDVLFEEHEQFAAGCGGGGGGCNGPTVPFAELLLFAAPDATPIWWTHCCSQDPIRSKMEMWTDGLLLSSSTASCA